jgi:hypothetical protein
MTVRPIKHIPVFRDAFAQDRPVGQVQGRAILFDVASDQPAGAARLSVVVAEKVRRRRRIRPLAAPERLDILRGLEIRAAAGRQDRRQKADVEFD